MSEVQVSHRFGWDAPSRIQAVTDLYTGVNEVPIPGEIVYETVLPFPFLTGAGMPAGMASYGLPSWRQEPGRLDLYFPAGDDVTVEIPFADDDYPKLDFTDQAAWQWFAHIRTGWGPTYYKVAEFICESVYVAPTTTVTMFLPRQDNWRSGSFYWDLQGISPAPLGPEEVPAPEEDPTPGTAYTLVSGRCYITQQVTTLPGEWPPRSPNPYGGTSTFLAVTTGSGKTVGPTGQVG